MDERIPAIEDYMVNVIENADLGIALNEVILGQKDRSSRFKPPLIWIFPSPSPITPNGGSGVCEAWTLRYTIVAVTNDHDIEQGRRDCQLLALRASYELIKNEIRRMMDGNASDTVRTGWIPAQDRVQNEDTMFGSGVEIEIRLSTKEG
jgi:hypothetical protein